MKLLEQLEHLEAELLEGPTTLTFDEFLPRDQGPGKRPLIVAHFKECALGLPMNRQRIKALYRIFRTDETRELEGKQITLVPKVQFWQGEEHAVLEIADPRAVARAVRPAFPARAPKTGLQPPPADEAPWEEPEPPPEAPKSALKRKPALPK